MRWAYSWLDGCTFDSKAIVDWLDRAFREEAASLLNNRRWIMYDFRETGSHSWILYGNEMVLFIFEGISSSSWPSAIGLIEG